MKRLCVFCGSSLGTEPRFTDTARQLGIAMVQRGLALVYGGGNIGLMGIIAETVLKEGGEVIGVIPEALVDRELAFHKITDLRIVKTMHERKALMSDLCDGFVALPGGFGTLEEICEMITWAQLGIHNKPCGLLNTQGFFNSLLAFFDHQVQQGFITPFNRTLVFEAKDPDSLLNGILKRGQWRGI